MSTNNNILLQPFNTPFCSVPFSKININDFEPAVLQLIEASKNEVLTIANNNAESTFENTIAALDYQGKQLGVVTATLFNLHSAETNDTIETIAQKISPALAALSNDMMLNESLFARVQTIYQQKDQLELSSEQLRLLIKTYNGFHRNGALLNDEDKARLRNIDQRLAVLSLNFSQNVLQDTNAYKLHLTSDTDLAGLPDSIIAMAAQDARSMNLDGWVFTLQYPSIIPFLKYADNRALREQIYMANAQKGLQENANNNEANIQEIVALKNQRAQLLGYKDYAAFVLEERMAKDTSTVIDFLNDLLEKAKPFATKEIEALQAFAKQDGITQIMPYDHAYYAEKIRVAKYDYSEEMLKPYFALDTVLESAFDVAKKLFNLHFVERNDIDVYRDDVKVYEVFLRDKHKGLLYTDFFPREGKRAGAWMTSYVGAYATSDAYQEPHVSIVCNFSKPLGNEPSLLTFMEVTTLFHEFGHALHGLLANTQYESLSGTNVYWDFVELPSQFMENFCYESEFLNTYAKHYQTGASLPSDLIDKIIASSNFLQGYQTLRQLSFGLLDIAYHTQQYKGGSVEVFEKQQIAPTQLYPAIANTAMSTSFSHIFAGGYAAGYYSYKWAEVLDADAFGYFKEEGIFNPTIGKKFMTLLQAGGTVDPMELYVAFRGRKPSNEALLKRAGLV